MRYFDHNATSPLCPAARAAWVEAVERFPGNPASLHRFGARAERALEEAREEVARVLGARPEDLVWTSGATEGNNAVLHHAARASEDGEAWISATEHPCVLAAAERWFPGRHRRVPVRPSGVVDVDWLVDRLRGVRPALIAVMAANNETGVLQPWGELARICREADVPFLCDAAQWFGKLPAAGLGEVSCVTGCAHKFGGPAGVGFLKAPARFQPLLVGGSQESGRRAGTVNVAGARACAAALVQREQEMRDRPSADRARARDAFEASVATSIPGVHFVGREAPRLWNTSAALLPVVDCRRRWTVRLDKAGFAVASGSACASGREKPSHVLAAMGLDGTGDRMVRASSGWETDAAAWEDLAGALRQVAAESGLA